MLGNDRLQTCPDHLIVMGGGRWARVLTEVLCRITSGNITVHTPHNVDGMLAWISERGLGRRVHVASELPRLPSGTSSAVIVANAARDHERAAEWALGQGFPVLVEKPIALDFSTARRLADMAERRQVYFASAHVFLFARYFETFAKLVADGESIRSVQVLWTDPQCESRHGELKSYDPGLTIYADWLPHIVSLVAALVPNRALSCTNLNFLRGGAQVSADLALGDITCAVQMARNGASRQRIVQVTTAANKKITLDFSTEPGSIASGSATFCGDTEWDAKPRPLACMLAAFLRGAAGGVRDKRLDVAVGLQACQLIDQVSFFYEAALLPWLSKSLLTTRGDADADTRYALSEILHAEEPHSHFPIGQRVDYVCRYISEHVASLRGELAERPVELIRSVLRQGALSSYS